MALLGRIGGLIVLALSALVLALSWERLPAQWVVHWGRGDQPNGWATRTPLGVFMPIALGVGLWVFLELLASVVQRMGVVPELDRATAAFIRVLSSALCSVFAGLALYLPLGQPQHSQALVVAVLVVVFGSISLGAIQLSRRVWNLKRDGVKGLENWTGLLYRNPADERLWVPKISGLGYTLNFAKPVAWVILAACLVPVALGLLVALGSH